MVRAFPKSIVSPTGLKTNKKLTTKAARDAFFFSSFVRILKGLIEVFSKSSLGIII